MRDQPKPVRSQTIISCRGVIYATLYDLLINPSKCFSKGCSSLKKKRGGVYDVGFKIWNTKIVEALYLAAAAAAVEIYEDDLNNEAISMIRNLALW